MVETQPRSCELCNGTGQWAKAGPGQSTNVVCPACHGNGWRWVTLIRGEASGSFSPFQQPGIQLWRSS